MSMRISPFAIAEVIGHLPSRAETEAFRASYVGPPLETHPISQWATPIPMAELPAQIVAASEKPVGVSEAVFVGTLGLGTWTPGAQFPVGGEEQKLTSGVETHIPGQGEREAGGPYGQEVPGPGRGSYYTNNAGLITFLLGLL